MKAKNEYRYETEQEVMKEVKRFARYLRHEEMAENSVLG